MSKTTDETINFVGAMVLLVLVIAFMIGYSIKKDENHLLKMENALLKQGYSNIQTDLTGEFKATLNGVSVGGIVKDDTVFLSK